MPAPLLIAHRGACGYRPELTRSAFALALEQGAQAIEIDVVASADGELIVRHDPELSRTTDVAAHPELRDRRRTKIVRGRPRHGWFPEDLSLTELRTLTGPPAPPDPRQTSVPVVIGSGSHPFPFRTRKLSLIPPMVLRGKLRGRVGRCRQ